MFDELVGQADLGGQAAHFGLVQLAHGKQRLGELGLVEPVQKIALVLAGVQRFQKLEAAGVFPDPRIVAGGDQVGA